jgi:hypothetical protein
METSFPMTVEGFILMDECREGERKRMRRRAVYKNGQSTEHGNDGLRGLTAQEYPPVEHENSIQNLQWQKVVLLKGQE